MSDSNWEVIPLRKACVECGHTAYYIEKYDAECCSYCNCWLEKACDDSACRFCATRPNKPRSVLVDSIKNKGSV